jgi:hypothetical protein
VLKVQSSRPSEVTAVLAEAGERRRIVHSPVGVFVADNGYLLRHIYVSVRESAQHTVCHHIARTDDSLRHTKLAADVALCELLAGAEPEVAEEDTVSVGSYPVRFKCPDIAFCADMRSLNALKSGEEVDVSEAVLLDEVRGQYFGTSPSRCPRSLFRVKLSAASVSRRTAPCYLKQYMI